MDSNAFASELLSKDLDESTRGLACQVALTMLLARPQEHVDVDLVRAAAERMLAELAEHPIPYERVLAAGLRWAVSPAGDPPAPLASPEAAPADWYLYCSELAACAWEAFARGESPGEFVAEARRRQAENEQPWLNAEPALARSRAIALIGVYNLLAAVEKLPSDIEAAQRMLGHAESCGDRSDIDLGILAAQLRTLIALPSS